MKRIGRVLRHGGVSATIMLGAPPHDRREHMRAKGTFEIKVTPVEVSPVGKDAGLGRYTLEKIFHGDIAGAAKGEMLTSLTESTGAMAYVAMDHVTGTLGGRSGTFYLLHSATMKKGNAASGVMKIVVVADSGAGDLTGLSGELTIIIDAKGGHSYLFDYELPERPIQPSSTVRPVTLS
jgi:Protein of unknown function (DUF3224)